MEGLQTWHYVIAIAIGSIGILKAYFLLRNKTLSTTFATKKEVEDAISVRDQRFDDIDKELGEQASAIANLPTKKENTRLSLELKETQGDLKAFEEMLKGTNKLLKALSTQVSLLLENELRGDKK